MWQLENAKSDIWQQTLIVWAVLHWHPPSFRAIKDEKCNIHNNTTSVCSPVSQINGSEKWVAIYSMQLIFLPIIYKKKQNNYINLGIGSNEQINPIHCLF